MTVARGDMLDVLEDLLGSQGEVSVPAGGLSMGRRLARADALLIQRAGERDARFGSVVVYRVDEERWIAHRIIWKFSRHSEWLCITKGDGNPGPDIPFVPKRALVGVVVGMRVGRREIRLDGPLSRMGQVVSGGWGLLRMGWWRMRRRFFGRRR